MSGRRSRDDSIAHRHVENVFDFRNVLIPVVTLVGLTFGHLMSGVVVLESVFAWPGVGQLAIQAVFSRDFPVVQAVVGLDRARTAYVFAFPVAP